MADKRKKKLEKTRQEIVLKKIYYFFIILIIALFGFWYLSKPLDMKVLDVKFEVGDRLGVVSGVSGEGSELNFGKLLIGSLSVKTVDIENNFNFPIKVDVFVSKGMEEFIFAKSDVVIESGKIFALPVNLILPDDVEKGDYSGKVRFEFNKVD